MLFESKAENALTWFSSAMVLTTRETYSGSGATALSCAIIESTCAIASCDLRVPMLIFSMAWVAWLAVAPSTTAVIVAGELWL
jgi:hypothetical protein